MKQKPPLIWTNVILFTVTFLIAAVLVPWYGMATGYSTSLWVMAILLLGYSGMSITAGYHRLWSHRAYEAHWSWRLIFAIGGAFALQNSALHWSSDHRIHHRHVDDNDQDPYSAKRGFWFSHIGWMLRNYQGERYGDYGNVRDLEKDAIVRWQHRHYLALALVTNIGIPLLVGWLCGDIIGGLLLCGVLRLVLSHHFTFFINSLAHVWGSQPYTDRNTARDNGILAFLTYGEGYHNYHHIFEADYRNGIRWYQFDPTKWLIWTGSKLGMTSRLKQAPEERIQLALLARQRDVIAARLSLNERARELEQRLHDEYEQLKAKTKAFYAVRKRLFDIRRKRLAKQYRGEMKELRSRMQELQQRLTEQQKSWQQFVLKYGSA